MKKAAILFILFLLVWIHSYSQCRNKTQREYFILGSLSDYMGRNLHPYFANEFENYHVVEMPLLKLVVSYLKKDYADYNLSIKTQDDYADMKSGSVMSSEIRNRFDSYYVEYKNEQIGKLKDSIFKTDEQRLAFLAGVFVKYGKIEGRIYQILVGNSLSKAQSSFAILKHFKCEATYQTLDKNVPVPHIVKFQPTIKVKTYLSYYSGIKKQMQMREEKLERFISKRNHLHK